MLGDKYPCKENFCLYIDSRKQKEMCYDSNDNFCESRDYQDYLGKSADVAIKKECFYTNAKSHSVE